MTAHINGIWHPRLQCDFGQLITRLIPGVLSNPYNLQCGIEN